jgi:hypothetical protein
VTDRQTGRTDARTDGRTDIQTEIGGGGEGGHAGRGGGYLDGSCAWPGGCLTRPALALLSPARARSVSPSRRISPQALGPSKSPSTVPAFALSLARTRSVALALAFSPCITSYILLRLPLLFRSLTYSTSSHTHTGAGGDWLLGRGRRGPLGRLALGRRRPRRASAQSPPPRRPGRRADR